MPIEFHVEFTHFQVSWYYYPEFFYSEEVNSLRLARREVLAVK